jgi:hypothetical protein
MENRFDDLTKALAEGIPRRQALWRMAGLFGGALLTTLVFGSTGQADSMCPPDTCKVNGKCEPLSVVGTRCYSSSIPSFIYCCPGLICCPPGVCSDRQRCF